MEQLNYRPDDVAGAVSQSLDQPVGTADAPKVESSEPIREMDNSQLVGAVSAGGGYQSTSATSVVDSGEVKRKRGRPARGQANLPPAKMNKEEEDVCFICFDGGSLVLCDRRGCPKAYHPTCIKRDDAFFQSKAKWNCGWHICSMCQKAAHHMCYTCTYSLCKGCIKKADYVCVRGDKGFCTICMRTIMLIENNVQGKEEMAQVDFDDKTSWEYLFKVYWVCLKEKLSLTMDELTRAKNPWKGSGTIGCERISPGVQNGANDIKCLQNGANDLKSLQNGGNALESLTLDVSPDNLEANSSKRRKTDKQLNLLHKATPILEKPGGESGTLLVGSKEWATKELLEFVAHMRNGDTSALSQFDVQALMLEYIKKNNLRDPRLKSQILCDSRLYSLFGKPRVGHFEMLKLLEFHFPVNEDSQKNIVGAAAREVDPDWNSDSMLMVDKDKKRKPRRKGEERPPQANLDEYAAIDVHNINLIYLRRGLMENLLEDKEKFHLKVVGSIVRIRISSGDQKQDMYRLVQVVGTSKLDKPYKIGNKTTDVVLEVLNLNKKETVSADTISNQEFSEDECRRLRQSIRCGLVKHFTVGEILEKAVALQSVKLNDWLETEILRLNHLRDRASEKGKKRELRECVEKLELLKTPEECQRRLSEIPEVHADPKMNPECESEEDAAQLNDNKREEYMKTRHSGYRGNGSKSSSPQKRSEGSKNDTGGRVLYTENSVKAWGKKQNEVICNNQAAVTSASFSVITSEKSASSLTMGNTLSAQESEADKMWHYRDPNGRVQGPFTMVQLQKWSTTGYFPTDMRIWANRQEDSVLLTDALKGEFHKALPYNAPLQSDVGSASYSKSNGYNVRRSENNSTQRVKNQSDGQSLLSQSSGQNWKTFSSVLGSNNPSSNLSAAAASVTKSTYVIEMNGAAVLSNLHSPTPRASHDNWEGQGNQKEGNADILDLPSPTPKTSSKADIVMDDREKPSEPSKLVVQDSGPTRSTASNLVVGGAQIAEIADEWGGYSPTPAKPSAGEWNSGDHVDTSKSNIDQFIHASQLHTVSTMSWQAIGSEPIEFSTLAEESVSDLLAEVDAMESQCGLPSPTSKRNFVDDLFHGSIEEFSCTPDQGARSDGFSSSGDMHLPCQSATPKELMGPSQGNLFSFLKSFLKRSKVDGEAKSSAAPVNHGQGMIRVESNAGVGTLTESSPRAKEAVGETQSSDVWVYVEEDAKPVGPTNSVDPNSGQKEKSETTVNWNNTTIQQGGAGGETVLDSATRVEEKREIHSSNAPTTIQHGGSGTAVLECSVRAEKEGEIKSIAVSVELEKREIKSCSDLVDPDIAVEDGAKVTDNVPNSTSIQQEGGNVRFKESAARAEREINSSEIIQPIQSAAPPLTTSQEPVDQSNAQRAGSSFGRQSPGTTNTGRGNANTGGRGSVGPADSQQRYNGESYNGGPRDQGYNNQGRGTWNRQSYGGDGGGYSRPPVLPPPVPPAKGRRVCKFYESGRCKKGALCGYLHP